MMTTSGPSIRVLDDTKARFLFVLSGVPSSVANGIRRTAMAEVPRLAIDCVEVKINTTVMNDDLLFHRLSMVPLVSDAADDDLLFRYECNCDDGCDRCTALFSLHITNTSDETRSITTDDLIPSNPKFIPRAGPPILLVKLAKQQELSFVAKAVKSTVRAENNAKFKAAQDIAYFPIADIRVNQLLINQHLSPDQQRQLCALGHTFEYDASRGGIVVIDPVRYRYTGDEIELLGDLLHPQTPSPAAAEGAKSDIAVMEEALRKVPRHPMDMLHPMLEIRPKADAFLFTITSSGVLPPKTVLRKALQNLYQRIAAIQMLVRRAAVVTR
jgi:hypothetical protein